MNEWYDNKFNIYNINKTIRMNRWMSEWMNKWTDEQMSKWTNKWSKTLRHTWKKINKKHVAIMFQSISSIFFVWDYLIKFD